jgi:trehalose 6-phosphate synthase
VVREADGVLGDPGAVTAFGRTLKVGAFPIGIDAEAFGKTARSSEARAIARRMRVSIAGRDMIVGVDRLDYSKGLEERFLAYERFLTDNPDWLNRVFLLQIAPPSRSALGSYQEIRDRLEAQSGRINGAFAEMDWVPLRYVNRGHNRAELAGIYRTARVGLVTPIRDGMNLVAKEYVAAQDPADPGVLILSRFAGAASQMGDALLVNPYAMEEMADAIREALTMDKAERKRRWETLMHEVTTNDVTRWREDFVAALTAVPRR